METLKEKLAVKEQSHTGGAPIVKHIPVVSIGCPKEIYERECRVAITPETAACYVKMGLTVMIQKQAGAAANFTDQSYLDAGAKLVDEAETVFQCDLVLKVRPVTEDEALLLRPNCVLISFVHPAQNRELISIFEQQRLTVFAMDQIPRISKAQVYDALSSMANIAGYKAVVEASHLFGRFLGGQMTAAGRIPPAKVLVIGAGVAGLSAIATAKKMGAIVRCFDTRPACREQVASLGGDFLELEGFELAEGTGGYAKVMSPEFIEAEKRLFAQQAADVDVIITTALVPGMKAAPILITREMVHNMKPGSVTIDLAAEQGGNIETTVKDEISVTPNYVTCVGYTDLPSRLPNQSSRLYAKNVQKLVSAYMKNNIIELNFTDLVVRASIVTCDGELIWPAPRHLFPPPPAAKPALATPTKELGIPRDLDGRDANMLTERRKTFATAVSVSVALCTMLSFNFLSHDPNLLTLIVVFALAGITGYQTVWGVKPALHTPLMSVTNAISGVTALGGLILLASASDQLAFTLGAVATGASFVNIIGGFTVTARMLNMFRRVGDPEEYNHYYIIPAVTAISLYAFATWGLDLDISELTYLAASLCSIVAIGGLARQELARFGNAMGMIGVALGVSATIGLLHFTLSGVTFGLLIILAGCFVGYIIGMSVSVTGLPQTVAAFHSLVGLAAMVTSIGHFALHPYGSPDYTITTGVGAVLGTFIGGVTLTGSIVAFAKLHALIKSTPLSLIGKNYINLATVLTQAVIAMQFIDPTISFDSANPESGKHYGLQKLYYTAALSMFLGWHTVASIGGGDMPVCITVLNSYSGWALVAEGFMLDNLMLTIVGSLIGFSGGILSYIMCKAMNRSLANVLFGGYATVASSKQVKERRTHRETTVEEVVELLTQAKSVMIVPGYGMAVARAQYAVADLATILREKGVDVRFAVHPVAGRMPGQMNVLLAEAGVPYDWVFEMDEVNDEFGASDVALVVGANDITNSAAEEDPACSIAGMPVLKVWNAKTCVYMKRTMGSGYADLDNPVFYKDNTLMMLGDAKKTTEAFAAKLKDYYQV